LCTTLSRIRSICVTILGGVYSLIIFLYLNFWELFIVKILMGLFLVLVGFGFKSRKIFLKSLLTFFLVNFIYGGFVFAVWTFITPSFMQYNNGIVYFNVSALTLAATTIAAYIVIEIFNYIYKKQNKSSNFYQIEIWCDGKCVLLDGFLDTGNRLVDMFTGLPIIVCDFEHIKDILPKSMWSFFINPQDLDFFSKSHEKWDKKVRIIPVNSVLGEGTLPAFKPDIFEIKIDKVKERKPVIIAVANLKKHNSSYKAILSDSLL
ncbi:MAG: sigma-E processing peptidase SpoIIGA, partial [Oscillospiraceae bacterium]